MKKLYSSTEKQLAVEFENPTSTSTKPSTNPVSTVTLSKHQQELAIFNNPLDRRMKTKSY